jgi:hypothetical protein
MLVKMCKRSAPDRPAIFNGGMRYSQEGWSSFSATKEFCHAYNQRVALSKCHRGWNIKRQFYDFDDEVF